MVSLYSLSSPFSLDEILNNLNLSLSFANGHVLQSSIYIKRMRGDPGATQVPVVVVALELIEEGRAG